jgi:hypothetical protein
MKMIQIDAQTIQYNNKKIALNAEKITMIIDLGNIATAIRLGEKEEIMVNIGFDILLGILKKNENFGQIQTTRV